MDWAAEHLLVALQRLEEALDEYYGYGHGSSSSPSSLAFAGLELVVMQVRRWIAGVLIWQSMAQGFSSRASTHTNAFPLPHTQTPKHAQHDTALDAAEGRLLLCPSDPPLRWVAALADATPEVRIHLHTCACMFVCIIYIRTRRARREGHRQTTTNTYDFNHRRSGASGRCAGGRRPSCAPCRTWRCQVRI